MTNREWALNFCLEHGMSESDATALLDKLRRDDDLKDVGTAIRWDDRFFYYHRPKLIARLVISMAGAARIQENKPRA
jgi:hypothetical protein